MASDMNGNWFLPQSLSDQYSVILVTLVTLVSLYLIRRTYRWILPEEHIWDVSKTQWKRVRNVNKDEGPPELLNTWYPICRSDEVKRNQLKGVWAFGKDLVVFRTSSGKVHVLDAYCPHMGTYLPVGGKVEGESIRCPFHGWTFNGEGECNFVPGLDSGNLPKAKIHKYEYLEMNGFIMVWYHSKNEPAHWKPSQIPNFESLTYGGSFRINCQGYFTDVPFNGCDYSHFGCIHGQPLASVKSMLEHDLWFHLFNKVITITFKAIGQPHNPDRPQTYQVILEFEVYILGYRIMCFSDKLMFDGPCLQYFLPFFGTNDESSFLSRLIPFIVLGIIPQPNKTFIVVGIPYCNPGILPKFISRLMLRFMVNETTRDTAVWANRKYLNKPIYSKAEKGMVFGSRWLNQFCDQGQVFGT